MFDKNLFIENSLKESSEIKLKILETCVIQITKSIDKLVNTIKTGNKILLIGNGGSAADCQHLATEFMIRLSHDLNRPAIPALALTTDSSNLTAGGNDIGFENVMVRNVEGLGNKGDILIAISTSGNSPNILKAVEVAKLKQISTIGLLGGTGGKLKDLVDISIIVPTKNVQRIQEGHITIGHIFCESVERELYGN
ncbi:MAG: SIS domain-containing protein [Ignavibacteriales bacterium]|nr:SIS domain-containing protein [Ignavibacteriales bacterium]